MKKLLALTVCILLHLTQVHGEDLSNSEKTQASSETAAAVSNSGDVDVSRAKRAVLDMRRLARGIQMLRLGKRSLPLLRLGKRDYPEDDPFLQDLLSSMESQYYDEDEYPAFEESLHGARYRRSAEPSLDAAAKAESAPSQPVKRSADFLDGATEQMAGEEGDYRDEEAEVDKRPMSMLRLGKRPVSMLRLGKRPVSMLRLGKRPMSMLRLGKRDGDEEEVMGAYDILEPALDEEELSADKRPVSMLRLGKRPVGMLRLGKRPVGMLRLGKRPVSMLRLGKRQIPMLRLGKRAAE